MRAASTSGNVGVWALSPAGALSPIAGGGSGSALGDGGPATAADLSCAVGLALDEANRLLYIVDSWNNRVRTVDLATGAINSVAGGGSAGAPGYGEGGSPTDAQLNAPQHIVLMPDGALLVDDESLGLRRIDTAANVIETFAAFSPCPATRPNPSALCLISRGGNGIPMVLDDAGRLFVYANFRSTRLGADDATAPAIGRREADGSFSHVFGQSGGGVTAGTVSTAAGSSSVRGLAFDPAGNLYFTDDDAKRVFRIESRTLALQLVAGTGSDGTAGDYGAATAATLSSPGPITMLADGHALVGDAFVGDAFSGTIRMIRDAARASGGNAALSLTSGSMQSVVLGRQSALLAARLTDGASTGLGRRTLDYAFVASGTGALTNATPVTGPTGSTSAVMRSGRIAGRYDVTASFTDLHGVHVTGSPLTFEVTATEPAAGVILPIVNALRSTTGAPVIDGEPAIVAAPFSDPPGVQDLAAGLDGTIYIANAFPEILAVSPEGAMRRIAGGGSEVPTDGADAFAIQGGAYGLFLDEAAGRLRLYVAGNGGGSGKAYFVDLRAGTIGISLALAALDAQSYDVYDLVVAADETVFAVAGNSSTGVTEILQATPAGDVTTLATSNFSATCGASVEVNQLSRYDSSNSHGLARDGAGSLYFEAQACGGSIGAEPTDVLLRRTTAGEYEVLSRDTLSSPATIALDAANNLYYTTSDGRLRRRTSSGMTSTLAGMTGMTTMSTGDFGPATAALLQAPRGVAVLPGNRVVVGETLGTTYMLRVIW